MIEAIRHLLTTRASPDRPAALLFGMLCGAVCARWLDAEWVMLHWFGSDAILAASAAVAASNVFSLIIPLYVRRRVAGGAPFEAAYRCHARSCSRYAGTVMSAVLMLAVLGTPEAVHRSDVAVAMLRFLVASYAGVLACDVATIGLTLLTFLTTLPESVDVA